MHLWENGPLRFRLFVNRKRFACALSLCATLGILIALAILCVLAIMPTFVESIRLLADNLPSSSQELVGKPGALLGQMDVTTIKDLPQSH